MGLFRNRPVYSIAWPRITSTGTFQWCSRGLPLRIVTISRLRRRSQSETLRLAVRPRVLCSEMRCSLFLEKSSSLRGKQYVVLQRWRGVSRVRSFSLRRWRSSLPTLPSSHIRDVPTHYYCTHHRTRW